VVERKSQLLDDYYLSEAIRTHGKKLPQITEEVRIKNLLGNIIVPVTCAVEAGDITTEEAEKFFIRFEEQSGVTVDRDTFLLR